MSYYLDALKKHSVFTGRATKKEYWMYVLITLIIQFALFFIGSAIGIKILSSIYALAVFVPGIAIGARRLHDIGKSGYW